MTRGAEETFSLLLRRFVMDDSSRNLIGDDVWVLFLSTQTSTAVVAEQITKKGLTVLKFCAEETFSVV